MDIQNEKLELIEWLVQLTDLELLNRIKSLKDAAEAANYEDSLKPMS